MYSQPSSLSRHRRVHKREMDEETQKEVKRRRVMLAISGRGMCVTEESEGSAMPETEATKIVSV